MEIESPNKENILGDNYFQILYPNQNYKLSLEYKQWKKKIENILGKNGKEVFCEEDNIIIYQKYSKMDNGVICPICKKYLYVCKYCKKISSVVTERCCLKALINEKIKDSYKFITMENEEDKWDYYCNFYINFIPFSFSLQTIALPISLIMEIEDTKGMKDNLKDSFENILFLFIYLMLIPYTLFFYSIYFIIFILSLPFKLYPIKLLNGFYCSVMD